MTRKYYSNRKSGLNRKEFEHLGIDHAVYFRTYLPSEVPKKYRKPDMKAIDPENKIHIVFGADGHPLFWINDLKEIIGELKEINEDGGIELAPQEIH